MAEVTPFRAVRYTGAAGDLADLVAPPYDAVDDEERARLYTRSPYNVVHVTLPESAAAAGRLYRDWLASGILARDDDEAMWLAAERYVGPDGVERERHGVIGSVAAEPYATGGVLPHERTHARIRDDRLELLRATRVQPEPLLLLAAGTLEPSLPERKPDLEADGTRLWRSDRERGDRRGRAAGRRRPPSLRERRRARTRARRLVAHHGARRLRRRRGSARVPDPPRLRGATRSLGAPAGGAGRGSRRGAGCARARAARPLCGAGLSPRAGRARPRLRRRPGRGPGRPARSRRHRLHARARGRRPRPSTAAMQTSRSSCGRRSSTTPSRWRVAASGCRRRARTSPRSRSRASSSTRSSDDALARDLPALRRGHPRRPRAATDARRARARAAAGPGGRRHDGDRPGGGGRRRRAARRARRGLRARVRGARGTEVRAAEASCASSSIRSTAP